MMIEIAEQCRNYSRSLKNLIPETGDPQRLEELLILNDDLDVVLTTYESIVDARRGRSASASSSSAAARPRAASVPAAPAVGQPGVVVGSLVDFDDDDDPPP